MNNKLIIIATGIFILASFIFLTVVEKKQADINTKNVWMIHFENPKDNSLDFSIENHSDDEDFHWEILADKSKVSQGDTVIANGSTKKIPVLATDTKNKKMTVIVTSGEKKKEIYKIFSD